MNTTHPSIYQDRAAESRRLEECQRTAWTRWSSLFLEPDCLQDPDKRRAMVTARLEYQDAVAEWLAFQWQPSSQINYWGVSRCSR